MNKAVRVTVAITILVVLCLVFYMYLDNKNADSSKEEETTLVDAVDSVLSVDLSTNYPKTPREVVKYFVDIQKCFYNEETKKDELEALAHQLVKLLDNEVIKDNNIDTDFDTYLHNLISEMDEFFLVDKIINKTIFDKATEVQYSMIDNIQYASLNCTYYLKYDKGTEKVVETYILRRDENDTWKILGWRIYED